MRPKLKVDSNDLSFGKIGAKLGELWRSLSAEEKRPYEDEASQDRERYRKEMEAYKQGDDFSSDGHPSKRQKLDVVDDHEHSTHDDGEEYHTTPHSPPKLTTRIGRTAADDDDNDNDDDEDDEESKAIDGSKNQNETLLHVNPNT